MTSAIVVAVFAVSGMAATLMVGCTATHRAGDVVDAPSPAYADSLYARMKAAFAANDHERAEAQAREMIRLFPNDPRAQDVYWLAAQASRAMGAFGQVARYAAVIPEQFPLAPHREDALFLLAEAWTELEKYYESADAYSVLLDSPIDAEKRAWCLAALREISRDRLSPNELERLIKKHPASPLTGEVSLALAKREFARGDYDRAYRLLAGLLYEFPEHKQAPEVRQLLQLAARRRDDPSHRVDYIEPNRVGVLLPMTGPYSRYGRYFEQGIELAVGDYAELTGRTVEFVQADSHGNPVDAVEAVRKLVLEEGVIGIVGSVFSVPSIAAAIEANAWRVSLLSPVVSDRRIGEIGPWVFETIVSKEVEVSAMARVARSELLLERFAVLAPSSGEKQELARFFIQEILSLGGEIVADEYYKTGDADFRAQLEAIREAAPDALFIPGDPEELILILPQVSFYDMQVQLLGLSDWNSEKLLRLSQREIEGAIFPREAHHGRDRESYQYFVTRYRAAFGGEAHVVAAAGYFGARVLMAAIGSGAVDREQVRGFLDKELHKDAAGRMAEAESLPILRVSSGKVREFTAFARPDAGDVGGD